MPEENVELDQDKANNFRDAIKSSETDYRKTMQPDEPLPNTIITIAGKQGEQSTNGTAGAGPDRETTQDLPSPTLEQVLDLKSKITTGSAYRLRQSGPGTPGPIGNPAGVFDNLKSPLTEKPQQQSATPDPTGGQKDS